MTFEPRVDHDGAIARWYAFCDGEMLVRVGDDGTVTLPEHDLVAELAVRTQVLGLYEGEWCGSAELPPDWSAPAGYELRELRALYGPLDEHEWSIAGRAVQLVAWERDHQFCGRCGVPTEPTRGERARRCPRCRLLAFPRLSPAVITAVTRDDRILLARGVNFPPGMFSVLAGFVDPGETLEHTVVREIREEVAIDVANVRYFGSQPWPFPNSLMIGFTADYAGGEIEIDETELVEAGWYARDALPPLPPHLSIARRLIDAWISAAD